MNISDSNIKSATSGALHYPGKFIDGYVNKRYNRNPGVTLHFNFVTFRNRTFSGVDVSNDTCFA